MRGRLTQLTITGCLFLFVSCQQPVSPSRLEEAELIHQNLDQLTQVIIYDVFTPPVASRIYVYASLAAFEAIRFAGSDASITARLNGFAPMPQPEPGKSYNFSLASTKAFFSVARKVKVFSVDSLDSYENNVYRQFKAQLDDLVYERSVRFGDTIAAVILSRAKSDGYLQSRGKPKFLGSEEAGKWRPTPPDYLDGVEWCWNTMRPMVLDSASQFMPPRPPKFDRDTNSLFYRNAKEVWNIGRQLTQEQRDMARYWDDNPFVIEHSGHMMFGNKKITPGGHWMGIAAIAARMKKADPVMAAKTYALTAISLFDAFIACWDEKYRSNVVRPVTIINEWMDPSWSPFLQTPPFPEYTSGHSTITAAAAEVMTKLYGDNFAFLDTSDLRYIGMKRSFASFHQAAAEASWSRVLGGIHYRSGVEAGAAQGKQVGQLVIRKLLEN